MEGMELAIANRTMMNSVDVDLVGLESITKFEMKV
jgi:hypothetical protein